MEKIKEASDETPVTGNLRSLGNENANSGRPAEFMELEQIPHRLSTSKFHIITLISCLAVLCVALDITIIATAISRMTDQF